MSEHSSAQQQQRARASVPALFLAHLRTASRTILRLSSARVSPHASRYHCLSLNLMLLRGRELRAMVAMNASNV